MCKNCGIWIEVFCVAMGCGGSLLVAMIPQVTTLGKSLTRGVCSFTRACGENIARDEN